MVNLAGKIVEVQFVGSIYEEELHSANSTIVSKSVSTLLGHTYAAVSQDIDLELMEAVMVSKIKIINFMPYLSNF